MVASKLDSVLLGLIKIHAGATGYDLKTIIGASTGYFFKASFSQIYPALARLVDAGLVTFTESDENGRPKKHYLITPAGCDALDAWLAEPIEYEFSESSIWELVLKLTFMGTSELEVTRKVLAEAKAHFEEEREYLHGRHLGIEESYLDPDSPKREVYLRLWDCEYSYIVEEADRKVAWLERCLQTVDELMK